MIEMGSVVKKFKYIGVIGTKYTNLLIKYMKNIDLTTKKNTKFTQRLLLNNL